MTTISVFSYIEAREVLTVGRKTRQWELYAQNGALLGYVEWLSRWRKYTFRPTTTDTTWFEQVCLREIAAFIESETKAHQTKEKNATVQSEDAVKVYGYGTPHGPQTPKDIHDEAHRIYDDADWSTEATAFIRGAQWERNRAEQAKGGDV